MAPGRFEIGTLQLVGTALLLVLGSQEMWKRQMNQCELLATASAGEAAAAVGFRKSDGYCVSLGLKDDLEPALNGFSP